MSEPISEADRIRNKRLAKLGSQNTSTSDTENQKAQPSDSLDNSSKATASKIPSAGQNQIAKHNQNAAKEAKPIINITSTSSKKSQIEGASYVTKPRAQTHTKETIEEWADRTLTNLFKITVKNNGSKDMHGNDLFFLSDLVSDLEQDASPRLLNTGLLDQALVEVASKQKSTRPLSYFLTCFKRITKMQRSSKNGQLDDAKAQILKEARRICTSYCIFAVTLPDMFGQQPQAVNPLTHHLLQDPDSDTGICHDFLQEAVARFPEDDSVKETLIQAVDHLSYVLSTKSMNDNYMPYLTAMRNLTRYPQIVIAMTESPRFLPEQTQAQYIEKQTLLGPFFQLSPLQGEVALNYFSSPRTRDARYIANSQSALRMTLTQLQSQLFEIADRFIKVSKETREKILDWFASIVNTNHKRRAMQTDPRYVSSDGFMVNVTVCLDRLCEPFIDIVNFSKVNRIEAEYFRRSPRVDIHDETKINADQPTSDEFYKSKMEGTSNFISEIFFLTVAAHHYGTEAANTKLSSLERQLRHMDKELEKFEAEREKYLNAHPAVLARFDENLRKFKEQSDRGHSILHATRGILLDEQLQARAMSFMTHVIVWLLRLVSGVDFPKVGVDIPLPREQPEVFKCLPEYFIEDIVDHLKFITSHMPQVITETQCNELVVICITFLRSSDYIKNPYLKAGLVTILFYGVLRSPLSTYGVLSNTFNSLPFARKHLLHALMQFYIECESTGAHTQFYDKFNIRYEIFQVIKSIWGNAEYRSQLGAQASDNVDFFVRFVNLLMNDVTFVLDESFGAFEQISSLTAELKSSGSSMEESTRQQKEEALEAAQGKAKSYMSLTIETVDMLQLFTDALADSFTMPEIVQRLADMLDYNLDALVGPKQNRLKVEEPEKYKFDPASLLSDLVDVYLNLSGKSSFQLAVARDGRSYKPANFFKAKDILQAKNKKSPEQLKRWTDFVSAVEKVKAEDDQEEQDIGEFPDEFSDPIMGILMRDPVLLPTSRSIVDRSTIRQILLSDGLDPFNRAPLTIEDVVPATDLKMKIDAFIQEKKSQKAQASNSDPMDIS